MDMTAFSAGIKHFLGIEWRMMIIIHNQISLFVLGDEDLCSGNKGGEIECVPLPFLKIATAAGRSI